MIVLFLLIIVLVYTVIYAQEIRQNFKKLSKENISAKYQPDVDSLDLDTMEGDEFEMFCGNLFIKMGYNVNYTPATNDFGVDLIIKKNNEIIVVQAKRYSKNVGSKAVQEIIGGVLHYHATHGIVVTTAERYTDSAIKLAKSCRIKLFTIKEIMYFADNKQDLIF